MTCLLILFTLPLKGLVKPIKLVGHNPGSLSFSLEHVNHLSSCSSMQVHHGAWANPSWHSVRSACTLYRPPVYHRANKKRQTISTLWACLCTVEGNHNNWENQRWIFSTQKDPTTRIWTLNKHSTFLQSSFLHCASTAPLWAKRLTCMWSIYYSLSGHLVFIFLSEMSSILNRSSTFQLMQQIFAVILWQNRTQLWHSLPLVTETHRLSFVLI